jgi:hypothetical protein
MKPAALTNRADKRRSRRMVDKQSRFTPFGPCRYAVEGSDPSHEDLNVKPIKFSDRPL